MGEIAVDSSEEQCKEITEQIVIMLRMTMTSPQTLAKKQVTPSKGLAIESVKKPQSSKQDQRKRVARAS
jgi:hypothetical protein